MSDDDEDDLIARMRAWRNTMPNPDEELVLVPRPPFSATSLRDIETLARLMRQAGWNVRIDYEVAGKT